MSRNKGTFNFSANFEVLAKAPLDARMLVDLKSDLTNSTTWEDADNNIWLFDGAIVSVSADPSIENNGIYFLKDANGYTDIDNWVLAGSNTDSSIGVINVGDGSGNVFAGYDSSGNIQLRTIEGSGQITVTQSNNQIVIGLEGDNFGVNGGVWFSDITPVNSNDNVGDKVFSSDGRVLDSLVTSTNNVNLHILALPGNTNYKPVVKVDNTIIPLTENSDRPVFTGSYVWDLNDVSTLQVIHEDGASDTIEIGYDSPPVVQTAIFTGGYPGSQTELKENDVYDISVTVNEDVVAYEIADYGAFKPKSETAISTSDSFVVNNLTIANKGTTTQDLGFQIRVKKSSGTWSNWFTSTSAGSVDGVNTVKLNNTYPTISITNIAYPPTQEALKGSETATISNTISNADVYLYTSPNSELSITNSSAYETSKVVTRVAGGYNITNNNITISATRTANGAARSINDVVNIADTNATIAISSPVRMISGGNDGTTIANHTIVITANQRLLSSASVTLNNVANAGVWASSNTFTTANHITYTNTLNVDDDHDKGPFTWGSFTATNLAGQSVITNTGQTQYTLGGFKQRTVTVPAFGRSAEINVAVVDYGKVPNTLDWSGKVGGLTLKRAVGTTATPDPLAWSIDQLDNNPTTINILDTAAADATSVASTITIVENI
jgi:hypothetical protein